jgi:hypothetical protein
MTTYARSIVALVLTISTLALGGCLAVVAAAGAAGGVAYVAGDLETTLNANPPQVIDAANAAVSDMNLARVSSTATDIDGMVIARTADDTKITIKVKQSGEGMSHLSIRVGVFGDEQVSLQVLENIRNNL